MDGEQKKYMLGKMLNEIPLSEYNKRAACQKKYDQASSLESRQRKARTVPYGRPAGILLLEREDAFDEAELYLNIRTNIGLTNLKF